MLSSTRRWSVAVLAFVMTATASAPLTAQTAARGDRNNMRIAVYDSRVIFDSMPERRAVESEFALEQAKARTMVQVASDSLRAALDELVAAEERLTPREREAGKLHLRARELLVEQMLENLDQVVQRRLFDLQQPLLVRVRDAVRIVRARLGYQIAFDLASEGIGIDADRSLDITQSVIEELRRMPRPVDSSKKQ